MSSEKKLHRTKVKQSRRKILLAEIFNSASFFYPSGDGRSVISGDVKFFDNERILKLKVKTIKANKKPRLSGVFILRSFRELVFIYFIRSNLFRA